MSDDNDILADPWLKKGTKSTSLPDDACFACAYGLFEGAFLLEEAAFFRRTETADELWITTGMALSIVAGAADGTGERVELSEDLRVGRVFAAPRKDERLISCLNLLDLLFRARLGFYAPEGFLAAGLVDESAFTSLIGRIRNELRGNARKAKEKETEIIKVARSLGHGPEPTGTGPSSWRARCPGGNHPVYINATENSFGCGWCKRKGAVEELRAFVKEREDQR